VISLPGRSLLVLPHAVKYPEYGQQHHSHVSSEVDGVAGMIFRTITGDVCPAVPGSAPDSERKIGVGGDRLTLRRCHQWYQA
jgi:hypothetical protein